MELKTVNEEGNSPIQENPENFSNQEDLQDQDFSSDDIYLMELHHRYIAMKQERKKAESETKLLDNRLKLLKGEEEKTWKKIAYTKKKANEKYIQLHKMAELMKQKEIVKANRERELEKKKLNNQYMRNEIQNNIKMKRDEKLRQLNEEARLLKLQKQYNQELTKYMKMEEINCNKNKWENIRGQYMLMEEKKKAQELERKLKLKMELEKKLLEEFRLKEEAEVYYSCIKIRVN